MGAPLRILSIGASCINRFQFQHFIERHPETAPAFLRGLFDWNIASLDASLRALRLARNGALTETLGDAERYRIAWDTLIVNGSLPEFSFFREDTPEQLLADPVRRTDFLQKIAHLSAPFATPKRGQRTHLVWSNIQPNLPDTVENVIPWESFRLTEPRYREARRLGCQIFGDDTTFTFIAAPPDAAHEVNAHRDVFLVDLPRGSDYEGPPGLFEPFLQKVLA
ncbi:hypothetical protein [Marivita sp. GX14005]|uniref:hypothetical protein n=1 Tax=Marivita sp. GX14005 TaxID=2942276 RepID=UPI00201969E0|nr:hypothetical protein [Marivita sp. GX14005]MCL3881843.1 hypothetical protein [Marivita sp. GX14005]